MHECQHQSGHGGGVASPECEHPLDQLGALIGQRRAKPGAKLRHALLELDIRLGEALLHLRFTLSDPLLRLRCTLGEPLLHLRIEPSEVELVHLTQPWGPRPGCWRRPSRSSLAWA